MSRMRIHALVFVMALGSLAAAGCGENPEPVRPDYSRDVQPVLTAHCVRCHGAGGTLNGDPETVSTFAVPTGKPIGGYFDCAEDRGDCSTAGSTTCKHGFRYYATDPMGHIAVAAWLHIMPPPPGAPLTTRESDILNRWLANPQPANVPCTP